MNKFYKKSNIEKLKKFRCIAFSVKWLGRPFSHFTHAKLQKHVAYCGSRKLLNSNLTNIIYKFTFSQYRYVTGL